MQFNDIYNYITEGNFGVQTTDKLDVVLISNGIAMAYDNDIAEKKDDFIKNCEVAIARFKKGDYGSYKNVKNASVLIGTYDSIYETIRIVENKGISTLMFDFER